MSESDDPDRDDPHFAHLNRLAQAQKKADMVEQMQRALIRSGALPPRQYTKDMLQFLVEERKKADALFQALQQTPGITGPPPPTPVDEKQSYSPPMGSGFRSELEKHYKESLPSRIQAELDTILKAAQADPIQAGGSTTEGDPMPLVDNGEALNISGAISAISVNNFQRHDPLPPDANGNPIVKVTMGYQLTLTIDTFDVETVKKLMLIRTRQRKQITADLIVWPL